MEIDYDKLAAAVLRQQQQQPSVAREVAVLNSPQQERGVSSSNTGTCAIVHSEVYHCLNNHSSVQTGRIKCLTAPNKTLSLFQEPPTKTLYGRVTDSFS